MQAYARDALMRRALGLVDVAAAYGALLLMVSSVYGATSVRIGTVAIAPFVLVMSKALGLYDRDPTRLRKTTIDELPLIFTLSVVYALTVWLAQALLLNGGLSRPQVFGLLVSTFAFITIGRAVGRFAVLTRMPSEACVFIGNSLDAARTTIKLAQSPGVNARVIGRVSLHPADRKHAAAIPVLGSLSGLADVVVKHDVERAIIAPDSHDQEDSLDAIRLLKALGVKVSVLPRLLEAVGSSSTFDDIDGLTLLGVRPYGLTQSSQLLKRAVDLVGASILLLLLSPTMLIVAVAIKLDSRGSVFFRQSRIGQGGGHFHMLKFRSMVRDAEGIKDKLRERNEAGSGLFKISDDPRITRVGRVLRQSSLDELPQLLNVMMGHMSLVGPRPLVPAEDALVEGWQRRRSTLRPGITGLWQVYGSARIPMPEMVKIDYLYGANWSIWLDLRIMMRTIPYVLRRRGL